MKLIAKGIQFTLTGTLYEPGQKAYKKLQKIGKEVSFSKSKTQVLIHEKSPSRKPEKAESWGIPVIDEAQLITLVEKGVLELESALDMPEGDASIAYPDAAEWRETARADHPAAAGRPGYSFVTFARR